MVWFLLKIKNIQILESEILNTQVSFFGTFLSCFAPSNKSLISKGPLIFVLVQKKHTKIIIKPFKNRNGCYRYIGTKAVHQKHLCIFCDMKNHLCFCLPQSTHIYICLHVYVCVCMYVRCERPLRKFLHTVYLQQMKHSQTLYTH